VHQLEELSGYEEDKMFQLASTEEDVLNTGNPEHRKITICKFVFVL